jgi:hypothetical protein
MQRMCVATDFGKKQIFWPLPPRGRENLAMNSYSKSMERPAPYNQHSVGQSQLRRWNEVE